MAAGLGRTGDPLGAGPGRAIFCTASGGVKASIHPQAGRCRNGGRWGHRRTCARVLRDGCDVSPRAVMDSRFVAPRPAKGAALHGPILQTTAVFKQDPSRRRGSAVQPRETGVTAPRLREEPRQATPVRQGAPHVRDRVLGIGARFLRSVRAWRRNVAVSRQPDVPPPEWHRASPAILAAGASSAECPLRWTMRHQQARSAGVPL